MLSSNQMKAARALLGLDQQRLADAAEVSLPTIRRMEGSEDFVRANTATLLKVVNTFERLGIELIAEGSASSEGGRGVRIKK